MDYNKYMNDLKKNNNSCKEAKRVEERLIKLIKGQEIRICELERKENKLNK